MADRHRPAGLCTLVRGAVRRPNGDRAAARTVGARHRRDQRAVRADRRPARGTETARALRTATRAGTRGGRAGRPHRPSAEGSRSGTRGVRRNVASETPPGASPAQKGKWAMSTFEDRLWMYLADEHGASEVTSTRTRAEASLLPRSAQARRRSLVMTTSALGVMAAAVALLVSVTASTQPAYALTHNPGGSITVTINDLQAAIPQLNARFAARSEEHTSE